MAKYALLEKSGKLAALYLISDNEYPPFIIYHGVKYIKTDTVEKHDTSAISALIYKKDLENE